MSNDNGKLKRLIKEDIEDPATMLWLIGFEEAQIAELKKRVLHGIRLTIEMGHLQVDARIDCPNFADRILGRSELFTFRRMANTGSWSVVAKGMLEPVPNNRFKSVPLPIPDLKVKADDKI